MIVSTHAASAAAHRRTNVGRNLHRTGLTITIYVSD